MQEPGSSIDPSVPDPITLFEIIPVAAAEKINAGPSVQTLRAT
jgi:hypothetical protein